MGLGKNQELSSYYFQALYPNQSHFFIGHAHNVYLEILAGIGLFGFVTWILWLLFAFRTLHSLKQPLKLCGFPVGILSAWIVFLVNGLTQVNFWEGKVLHQIAWVMGLTLYWASKRSPAAN